MRTALALAPRNLEVLNTAATLAQALGHFDDAIRIHEYDDALGRLIDGWGETWPSEIAHVHAWRGDYDQAFDWLERELDAYGPGGWGEWRLQRL